MATPHIFLVPVDLQKNELRNAVMQNLATAPSDPVVGQEYFDTNLSRKGIWNGSEWVYVGSLSDLSGDAPIQITGTGSSRSISISMASTDAAGAMSAADKTKLDGIESGATANASDADLRDRQTHTGVQAINTISGLQDALDAKVDDSQVGAANGVAPLGADSIVPATNLPPLDGRDAGTLDGEDGAYYLDRTNHTGTQAINTVTGLQTALDGKINTSARGAANGVASLDASGKVPTSQLPALAITSTHVVADIAARDALTVQEGDVAVVQDRGDGEPESYIYDGTAWQELSSPTDGVTEVTGGTGITVSGGRTPEVSITPGGVGTTQLADDGVTEAKLDPAVRTKLNDAGGALKHAQTIGNGTATSFTITHNFGTRDVDVAVYQAGSPYAKVYPGIEMSTVNAVTISFSVAPTTNQYRVVVLG